MDQVLKKAMEKRDQALREVERWESWIKAYAELAEPVNPLDPPMSRSAAPQVGPGDDLDIPTTLRMAAIPTEGNKGNGSLLRNGNAPN